MISLIISLYKRLDFLTLILQGLERQSYKNFEVIIAEDDNAPETVEFIEQAKKQYGFPIKHVSQEDIGFRKTKTLNAAVVTAKGEQLVFIDGDCIPHKHLLKEYAKAIRKNKICYGRRAYLSKKITAQLLQEKSISNLTFFKAYFSGSTHMGAAIYNPFLKNIDKQKREILGCNWGILREHIFSVNGFDEDYTRASVGEDLDINWRLKAQGMSMKSMKNRAIVYHLYHASNYNDSDTFSTLSLMHEKRKTGHLYCLNGINKND
ncbi:MAG: glycosyltransferase [Prevotellaceae bacterium]|nr:glycosyltransferase [Prevotellaceae bacterium]